MTRLGFGQMLPHSNTIMICFYISSTIHGANGNDHNQLLLPAVPTARGPVSANEKGPITKINLDNEPHVGVYKCDGPYLKPLISLDL